MARFRYRAVAASGELLQGEMDAVSQATVVERLRGQGHLPLAADEVAAGAARRRQLTLMQRLRQPVFGQARVTRREIAMMTRELATLLEAGLTLDQSLKLLIELAAGEPLEALLVDLLERIQGGSSLADALAQHDRLFPRVYVSMVRAGETGGALREVLGRLARYLDEAEVLREQVKSALVYPTLLLILAVVSIIILLTVVLPQFTPLFENAGAQLPWLTRAVMLVGDAVQRWWWLMLLAGIGAVGIARRQLRRPARRAQVDRWLLKVPLVGELLAKIDTARFARALGTLLANGVPPLTALAIVQDALTNATLRRALADAATAMKDGGGLAAPLGRSNVFPRLAVHLLGVGEESGQLDPMLLKIAEVFDRDVRSTIERLMALLVPVLTIMLGAIVAVIITSVLMAILSAYDLQL
jgi:general secretion pathway protein F